MNLFGRGVQGGAFKALSPAGGLLQGEGQPEIQKARAQVRADDHVVGLEIAVNQPALMRRGQTARHLAQQARFLLEAEFRRKPVQGIAFDPFHHDCRRLGFIEHGKNGDDRRIAQRGGMSRLVQDAAANRLLRPARQHLDGDRPVELLVVRRVNRSQATHAQLAFDPETRQPEWGCLALRLPTRPVSPQRSRAETGLDPLAGLSPYSLGQGRDEIPEAFGGSRRCRAHEDFGVSRRVQGSRSLRPNRVQGCAHGFFSAFGRAQEAAGRLMRVEQRLDFAAAGRVGGALRRHIFGARRARGYFKRPGEDVFRAGNRLIHQEIGLGGQYSRPPGRNQFKRKSGSRCNKMIRFVPRFRFVSMKGRRPRWSGGPDG